MRKDAVPVGRGLLPLGDPVVEIVGDAQDGERFAALVRGQRRPVPLEALLLHEGDAFRHDRAAGDERRAARVQGRSHGTVHGSDVVAVDLEDAPAVRLPVGDDVLRHDVRVASGELLAVPVEDGHEVRQAVARGEAARLRGLALLLLAVSHSAEHTRAVALDLRRQREAHRGREALPEVARSPVDARHVPLDVPLERRAAAAKAQERQGGVEIPEPRERRVRAGRNVPVADHDTVAIFLERLLRVAVPESPKDEQEVEGRHRAAGVPRGGESRHLQDVAPRVPPERGEAPGLRIRELRPLEAAEDQAFTPADAFTASARRDSIVARSSS